MSDQVLPRENGIRYPWNFIFKKCFWKKKKISNDHNSTLEVNVNKKFSENVLGKENSKPAVEAISLDMKQQELDGRYTLKNLNALMINSDH